MKIITHKGSFPSARLLRDTIYDHCGVRLLIVTNPALGNSQRPIIINYGYGGGDNLQGIEHNSPRAVRLMSNKDEFSSVIGHKNVTVPQFFTHTPLMSDIPFLIRRTLTSSGGRGIIVIGNADDWARNVNEIVHPFKVWTPFIRTTSEFRVHVINGAISKVFRKIRQSNLEEEEFPIRNSQNGYHFSLIEHPEKMGKLYDTVNKVHNAMPDGSMFYALDVGWRSDVKDYIVWEGNSAPGLNPLTAEVYAKFLIEELSLGG